jgi:hypothetical protein
VTPFRGDFKKYLISLLLIDLLVFVVGFFLIALTDINLQFSEIAVLTLLYSAIVLISLYVFDLGLKKEPSGQTMHLLAAITIKILLEMVLALFWFFVAKKTSASSLLLFFVLYLSFSLYSIFLMLNTLKNRTL